MMRRGSLAATAALVAVGCGGDESGPSVAMADSAGVRVVTNLSAEAPVWTLTTEPVLTLGSVDSGGPDQFFRIGSVRRLSDGGIVVSDGGSREIRTFAADGAHVRSFAGEGDGPGEFRGPARIRVLPGDTLAVWDTRLRRVTVFDPSGVVARTQTPRGISPRSDLAGYYADGRMLVVSQILVTEPTDFEQRFARYLVYGLAGELVDSLPRQPDVVTGPLGTGILGSGVASGPILFGEETQVAADRTGYWVGTQKSEEIVRYSLSGEVTTIVRWPAVDRRVGPNDADLELEETLANRRGGDPEAMTRLHDAMPVAERFPSHDAVLVDVGGRVWVREFERPGHVGPALWRVFGADGVLAGIVRVPADLDVRDVGEEYVLALARDDLDVQYVQMFGLVRAGA